MIKVRWCFKVLALHFHCPITQKSKKKLWKCNVCSLARTHTFVFFVPLKYTKAPYKGKK